MASLEVPVREDRRWRNGSKPKASSSSVRAARGLEDPSALPDRTLIERIADGEREALEQLYSRYGKGLHSFLVKILNGDRTTAEEVVQDTMLAVWRGAANFRSESEVETWIKAIAYNQVRQRWRSRERRTTRIRRWLASQIEPSSPSQAGQMLDDYSLDREGLCAAIERLSIDQREALVLTYFGGLNCRETADVLGVAPGTVKSRLHRAREALRSILGDALEHER